MRPMRNTWPSSESARNAMFIAQVMVEMLDREAFESFRAPTLDTLHRAHELEFIAKQIQDKRVKPITIIAAAKELCFSVKNDPIASNFLADECNELVGKIEKISNPTPSQTENIILQVRNFSRRLQPLYLKELSVEFSSLFEKTNEKNHALKICQILVSFLINSGYDRRYIDKMVKERFCEDDIKKFDKRTLSRFISTFDHKRNSYQVFIAVSEASHKFIELLSISSIKALRAADIPDRARVALTPFADLARYPKMVRVDVSRLDPYSAHKIAIDLLGTLESLTLLQKDAFELKWLQAGYVTTARSSSGTVVASEPFVIQHKTDNLTASKAKSLKAQARALMGSFDRPSMERVIGATGTVSLARSASHPENQLVLLWSSIEALLSDPPENVARVEHYLDSVVPCICLNYPRRYLCAVLDQATLYYKRELRQTLREVDIVDTDYPMRFAHFVIDPKYKTLQNEFCKKIDQNPLALYRFWKLYDNFKTGKAFFQSVDSHEKRVFWQMSRIYRVRNEIVHSGSGPTYSYALAQNAYEYFKTAFGSIVSRAEKTNIDEDIDDLVGSIAIDYSIFKSKLNNMRSSETRLCGDAITELFRKR